LVQFLEARFTLLNLTTGTPVLHQKIISTSISDIFLVIWAIDPPLELPEVPVPGFLFHVTSLPHEVVGLHSPVLQPKSFKFTMINTDQFGAELHELFL